METTFLKLFFPPQLAVIRKRNFTPQRR